LGKILSLCEAEVTQGDNPPGGRSRKGSKKTILAWRRIRRTSQTGEKLGDAGKKRLGLYPKKKRIAGPKLEIAQKRPTREPREKKGANLRVECEMK